MNKYELRDLKRRARIVLNQDARLSGTYRAIFMEHLDTVIAGENPRRNDGTDRD